MIAVHDLSRVSPATAEAWADHIAQHMRDGDKDEVRASSDMTPHEAITASLGLSSRAYAVVSDTHGPVAMFGASPHPLPGVGVVWMLGTDGITKEAIGIARRTRPAMEELHREYWLLWNFIDGRNAVSMRWLRWAGYKLLSEHRLGPEGRPFFTFARVINPNQNLQSVQVGEAFS